MLANKSNIADMNNFGSSLCLSRRVCGRDANTRHHGMRSGNRRQSGLRNISCSLVGSLKNETSFKDAKITIIGGGPAGMSTALALNRIGMTDVTVLESRSGISQSGTALGLWTNAWRALDALDVGDSLRAQHPRVERVELCSENSHRMLRSFSLNDCDGGPHEFRGVRRSSLVKALVEKLPAEVTKYDSCVKNIQNSEENICLMLENGNFVNTRALIAADGVRSAALAASGRRPVEYVGQTATRGIAHFPDGLPCDCIRQIWSVGPRAGMYPISESELYWFVCFDTTFPEREQNMTPEMIKEEAGSIVKTWGWNMQDIVDATPLNDLARNRLADRLDIERFIRSLSNQGSRNSLPLTLVGDALHPMTPNLGQGGCTALEDAVVLAKELSKARAHEGSATIASLLSDAFNSYENMRLRRCLPLTWRSRVFGSILQLPIPQVSMARDSFVEHLFNPGHFLDHATFDCGRLEDYILSK